MLTATGGAQAIYDLSPSHSVLGCSGHSSPVGLLFFQAPLADGFTGVNNKRLTNSLLLADGFTGVNNKRLTNSLLLADGFTGVNNKRLTNSLLLADGFTGVNSKRFTSSLLFELVSHHTCGKEDGS